MTRKKLWSGLGLLALVGACGDDDSGKRDAAPRMDAADGRGSGGMMAGGSGGTGGTGGSGGSPSDARADTRDAPMAGMDGADGADGTDGTDGTIDTPMPTDVPLPGLDGPRDTRRADVASLDLRRETGGPPTCGPFADGGRPVDAGTAPSSTMSFFVSSATSPTGNLGGLAGADQTCQQLAAAVGLPSALWRAYLSVEHDPPGTGGPVHARDRIGSGPWYNARGELLAADLASLHARPGDASLFLDERGNMINGQWTLSPTPNEHDILTGSNPDGTVAMGKTCADWTAGSASVDGGAPDGGGALVARVGHSDGIGPQCSTATSPTDYTSWNSSHDNAGCDDTAPRGGAGRIYCFKAD